MKVKVINKKTNQQFDCEEVEIDRYKYYLYYNTEPKKIGQYYITKDNQVDIVKTGKELGKPILCSNNPNIDIPKVIGKIDLTKLCYYDRRNPDFSIKEEYGYDKEEVEATGNFAKKDCACDNCFYGRSVLTEQLIKSQETHPFSEEDMIEFGQWVSHNDWVYLPSKKYWVNEEQEELEQKLSSEELLQIWKEQKPKTLYYV